MKIKGEIEVSGITMVVLNRSIVFTREEGEPYFKYVTMSGDGWFLYSSELMAKKIQRFIDNPNYRVWTHEQAVNILHKSLDVRE